MTIKKNLVSIALATVIGFSGCNNKDNSTNDKLNEPVVSNYQGLVTGVDYATPWHSQLLSFVLDNKYIFYCSRDLFKNGWDLNGPAGLIGLSARLRSAQQSKENISVNAIKMGDGGYCIKDVKFSEGTGYRIEIRTSQTLREMETEQERLRRLLKPEYFNKDQ